MKSIIKSFVPDSIIESKKYIQSQILQKKWKKDLTVADWCSKGWLSNKEISTLVFEWEKYESPIAQPHKVKQMVISEYAKKYNCSIFVETGTYKGDMIEAQKHTFKSLYSVELSKSLYERAIQRFTNESHINILHGDSAEVLHQLLPSLDESALFWLDGHYCGTGTALSKIECPIYEELNAIFNNNKGHIVLIDDARCFVGERDYPTIAELSRFIESNNPDYQVRISEDIIRIEKN